LVLELRFISLIFRWFHKYKESERLFVLRSTIQEYDVRHEADNLDISGLEDDDWEVIGAYIKVVEPFVSASRLLGGDSYPAAGMVVPMLDQVN
jgi:hypothetical protein